MSADAETDCVRRLAALCDEDGFPDETDVDEVVTTAREVIAECRRLDAEVDALRAEIAALHAERDRFIPANVELGKRTVELLVERDGFCEDRDELRAIVEGRTVPPTDAELDAHEAAGGRWVCVTPGDPFFSDAGMDADDARALRDLLRANDFTARWWALDASDRLVAEGGAP